MASNKNTGDVPNAVKKIRTAQGTITQVVQGGFKTNIRNPASAHEHKSSY